MSEKRKRGGGTGGGGGVRVKESVERGGNRGRWRSEG